MHNDVVNLADAHPAQVDFALGMDFRQVPAHRHRDFRSGRFRARDSKRGAGHGELHHSNGDDDLCISNLEDAPDLAAKGLDLDEVARAHFFAPRRRGLASGLAVDALELLSLLAGEALDALPRLARRLFAGFRCALELLDRPLDLGARLEKVLARLTPRASLHLTLALSDRELALGDPAGAIACILGDLTGFALGGGQRLLPRLQLREQSGDLSLVGRDSLLGPRED